MAEPADFAMQLLKRRPELGEWDADFPHTQGPVVAYHGKSATPDMREDIMRHGIGTHDTKAAQIGSGRYVQDQVGYHPETGEPIHRDRPTEAESYGGRKDYIDLDAPKIDTGWEQGVDQWNKDIPPSVSITDDAGQADYYSRKNYGHARNWEPTVYGVRAGALANQLPLDEPRRRYGARGGTFDDPEFYSTSNTYRYIPHNIPPEALVAMKGRAAEAHDKGEEYWDESRDERRGFNTHGGGKAYTDAWENYRAEVPGSHSDEDWRQEGFRQAFKAQQGHVDDALAQWQGQQAEQAELLANPPPVPQPDYTLANTSPTTLDMFQTGEPMEIAMRLLKAQLL